jgi:hypothetical protein
VSYTIGNNGIDFVLERVETDGRFGRLDEARGATRLARVFRISNELHQRVLRIGKRSDRVFNELA